MKLCSTHWLLALCLVLTYSVAVSAQEKEKPAPAAAQTDEIDAWTKYATPGEPHKYLQKLVGDWKTVIKSYEPGSDQPQVSEGTAKFESLLGGRFVRQTIKASMAGMPYEGIGIMGYDNSKQKQVGTWMDSFGTGILHTEGKYDPETHTVTDLASGSGPAGEMKMKMLTKYIDEDKFNFTLYMLVPGDQEIKLMEIEYTRKK